MKFVQRILFVIVIISLACLPYLVVHKWENYPSGYDYEHTGKVLEIYDLDRYGNVETTYSIENAIPLQLSNNQTLDRDAPVLINESSGSLEVPVRQNILFLKDWYKDISFKLGFVIIALILVFYPKKHLNQLFYLSDNLKRELKQDFPGYYEDRIKSGFKTRHAMQLLFTTLIILYAEWYQYPEDLVEEIDHYVERLDEEHQQKTSEPT